MESTTERRIDPDRVTGLAGTLGLHVAIAGALLAGVTPYLVERAQPESERFEATVIRPIVEPPPVPPMEQVREVQRAPLPVARPRPTSPPIVNETPSAIDPYVPELVVEAALPPGEGLPADGEPTDYAGGAAPTGAALAYVHAPPPAYPVEAVRRGQEGTVWLLVSVDAGGRPVEVRVDRSSGHRVLDQAARQQVMRHWRFQPAMRGGQAVPAMGRVPVNFSLQ